MRYKQIITPRMQAIIDTDIIPTFQININNLDTNTCDIHFLNALNYDEAEKRIHEKMRRIKKVHGKNYLINFIVNKTNLLSILPVNYFKK